MKGIFTKCSRMNETHRVTIVSCQGLHGTALSSAPFGHPYLAKQRTALQYGGSRFAYETSCHRLYLEPTIWWCAYITVPLTAIANSWTNRLSPLSSHWMEDSQTHRNCWSNHLSPWPQDTCCNKELTQTALCRACQLFALTLEKSVVCWAPSGGGLVRTCPVCAYASQKSRVILHGAHHVVFQEWNLKRDQGADRGTAA